MKYRFSKTAFCNALDSSLKGLQQYEGAPFERVRQATRHALQNLMELCDQRKAYNTGLFFALEMGRLREASIRVFIIADNHNAASQISKTLRLPANVKILSDTRPESVRIDGIDVEFTGMVSTRMR